MYINLKIVFFFIKGYANAKLGVFRSKAALMQRQSKLFQRLTKKTLVKSPYYQKYSARELSEYPVINKGVFMSKFNDINTELLDKDQCFDLALTAESSRNFKCKVNGFSVGLSSGTSGKRGMFVTSDHEQAEWAGYIIGKMLPFRFKKHRVAFFLRSNNNLYETSQGHLVEFKFFDLLKPITDLISDLEVFSPTVLVAPAQVLKVIAELEPNIFPQKIISVAEVLEAHVQEYIEKQFAVRVGQIYQCTEGFLASTCHLGSLHLNEDIIIIEKDWIDQASGRFSPIVTDLKRSTQPVIRYRLDDVLIEDKEACACGSSFTRLAAIEGRNDDVIWLKKNNGEGLLAIYPDPIRQTMLMIQDYFSDYRIVQINMSLAISLEIETKRDQAQQAVEQALSHFFVQQGVVVPEFIFDVWKKISYLDKCRRIQCQTKPVNNSEQRKLWEE